MSNFKCSVCDKISDDIGYFGFPKWRVCKQCAGQKDREDFISDILKALLIVFCVLYALRII